MKLEPQKILDHMLNTLPPTSTREEGSVNHTLLKTIAEGIVFAIKERDREIKQMVLNTAETIRPFNDIERR